MIVRGACGSVRWLAPRRPAGHGYAPSTGVISRNWWRRSSFSLSAASCSGKLLHVSTADPDRLLPDLTIAGAIFIGHLTPVALGDYAAGPSHVLPTSGTARWASGLSANDFLRRSSLIAVDDRGLAALAPDVRRLADVEGLTAHRWSVDVRQENRGRS